MSPPSGSTQLSNHGSRTSSLAQNRSRKKGRGLENDCNHAVTAVVWSQYIIYED